MLILWKSGNSNGDIEEETSELCWNLIYVKTTPQS